MEPKIVSHDAWIAARKELLTQEKELSRQRDAVAAARRALPMELVEKAYAFEGPDGKKTLSELFSGRRQLIVYHFMFDPSWEEGCKSCSFIAESFDGAISHLAARDTSFVAISRAPLAKIRAFQARMGWKFPWLSSAESDFNYDYHVSFLPADVASGSYEYNYRKGRFPTSEAPGLSVFCKDDEAVFHAYSTYARGLDILMTTYNYLDLTPLGRNEVGLPYGMAWLRHHDKYD